ncbi:MAG: phosphatidylglycerol lysyltransferase domain-containing protein [Pseudomonadota bacterium]
MTMIPIFPQFRPIQLEDRDFIHDILTKYQPETSEWTFTNLFIWRSHYGYHWSMHGDWLLVLSIETSKGVYALAPIGPPSRRGVTLTLLEWLREEKGAVPARIERADQRLVAEIEGTTAFLIEPDRDQFDYIYRSTDLITLAGRKYHGKRNHINKFRRTYPFSYASFEDKYMKPCLELAERWCVLHRCEDDLNLAGEWDAVHEILTNFHALKIRGGVILIENQVKAFALGEPLNDQTATVHIEKADPDIPELYAMINQQYCEKTWRDMAFINREQDLGESGLRKAKLSYYPDHLVEKYRIQLKG